MKIEKILFIGLSCVGDVVMTSPVMLALKEKFPEAIIDFVVDERSKDLYTNIPCLGKIVIKNKDKFLRGSPDLISQLWETRYDIIVDVRTDGLAYLLRGIKRYTKWFAKSYGPHAVEKLMGVIASLHGNNPIPDTHVWLSGSNREYAIKEIAVFNNQEKLLAISIGDILKSLKSWPTHKFVELLIKHRDDFSGIIFLGNHPEAERTLEVTRKIDIAHINTVGNSLLDAAALMEKSCLYIGPDSGLGHIASAVHIPTISFFSVDRPERCRPWGNKALYVEDKEGDARNIEVDKISDMIKKVLN